MTQSTQKTAYMLQRETTHNSTMIEANLFFVTLSEVCYAKTNSKIKI